MSKVVITIEDIPGGSTVRPTIRYPQGKHGADYSLAEAVAEDFKALLQGKGPDDFKLEYVAVHRRYGKARLELIRGGAP